MAHKCDDCGHCKILKKRLDIYEKCMKELQELDEENYGNFQNLEESIIISKDNNGNINKKIYSNLGESILVIEKGKKLDELNKKEQNVIMEQDNYRAYEQTIKASERVNTIMSYVLRIGKFILFI